MTAYPPHGSLSDKKSSVATAFATSVEPASLTIPSDGLHRQDYAYGRTLSDQDLSFFDFEPQVASFQLPSIVSDVNGPDHRCTWNDTDRQLMSPPDSAVFSPKAWPTFEYLQKPPENIHTDIKPGSSTTSRSEYGQVTPTDEDHLEHLNPVDQQPRPVDSPPAPPTAGRKRKRTSAAAAEPPSMIVPKRSRKDEIRLEGVGAPLADINDQDGNRRSKFLERNRLAASKCRQKKKQWVENLEVKARNLQAEYKHLNMVVDSLRDEILYLKVEMVRHQDCEGSEIQKIVKDDGDAFAEAVDCLQRSERERQENTAGSSSPRRARGKDVVQPTKPGDDQSRPDRRSASPVPLDDMNLAEVLLQDEHLQNPTDLSTPELVSPSAIGAST